MMIDPADTKQQPQEPSVMHRQSCVQFDALVGVTPGDDCFQGDEDGHLICWGEADEQLSGIAPVRLWIRSDTTKQAALALLKKIADTVEQCYAGWEEGGKAGVIDYEQEKRTNVIQFPARGRSGVSPC